MINSDRYDKNMSEKKIKKMICNHEYYLLNIQHQRISILSEIRDQQEYLSSLMLRSYRYDDMVTSRTNIVSDSVYATFLKLHESESQQTIILLQQRLDMLSVDECTLNRVCVCYHRMMTICPIGYDILYELCYKNKKDKTWEGMAHELGRSRTYLSNAMKIALKTIKKLYDTPLNTKDISNLSEDKLTDILSELVFELEKY